MPSEPPIDFNGIDSVVHGSIRLGVLCALKREGELDFTTLKKRLSAADGALGIHLLKLETIGYITCHKEFVGRRPRSTYRIAAEGSKALSIYLASMQRLIDSLG
jgi:DNA-binding HxlR family transcriptional regulator